jgi:polar amino acid transport system substrate-binding protein
MKNSKFTPYLSTMLIGLLLCFSAASAASEDNKVIKACGHHDYAPWNWLQDGHIVGVCVDLASQLFQQLGYTLDLSYVGPWKRCQQLIAQGKMDLNICAIKNDQRANYSEFSKYPIAQNENAIFVRADEPFEFNHLSDLKYQTVGLVRGVSLGNKVDDFLAKNTQLVLVEDFSRLFQMLVLKRIDLLIVGRASGLDYIKQGHIEQEVIDLPKPVAIFNLHMAMSKKSLFLPSLTEIDQILSAKEYQNADAQLFEHHSKMFMQYKSRALPEPEQ